MPPVVRPRRRLLFVAVLCLIITLLAILYYHYEATALTITRETGVIVIKAPPQIDTAVVLQDAAPKAEVAKDVTIESRTLKAFPILDAVVLKCQTDVCDLSATPRPAAVEQDREAIRGLYQGALEQFLLHQGMVLIAPIRTEEVGPAEEVLRLTLRPQERD